MTRRPVIALTPGEPAGIGPDIAIAFAQQAPDCDLVLIADPALPPERAALPDVAFHRPPRIPGCRIRDRTGGNDAGRAGQEPKCAAHGRANAASAGSARAAREAQGCARGAAGPAGGPGFPPCA